MELHVYLTESGGSRLYDWLKDFTCDKYGVPFIKLEDSHDIYKEVVSGVIECIENDYSFTYHVKEKFRNSKYVGFEILPSDFEVHISTSFKNVNVKWINPT